MMKLALSRHMLALFEAYQAHTGKSISAVQDDVFGFNVERRFVRFLRDPSKTFTIERYDFVVTKFAEIWPAGLAWPNLIIAPIQLAPRPVAAEKTPEAA